MNRFAYDQQLATIPAVVAGLLDGPPIAPLDRARPIVFAGIGTSLHAARIAADWIARLAGGEVRAVAADAHDIDRRALSSTRPRLRARPSTSAALSPAGPAPTMMQSQLAPRSSLVIGLSCRR